MICWMWARFKLMWNPTGAEPIDRLLVLRQISFSGSLNDCIDDVQYCPTQEATTPTLGNCSRRDTTSCIHAVVPR